MPYTPTNNPYAVGDPYMYDLKWVIRKIHEWTDPLDSAEQAKNSANAAAGSANAAAGSANAAANTAAGVEHLLDNYTDYFNEEINNQSSDIALLEARVSGFEQLAQGSTTGDAELIDGRTAYNGVVYATIGDAIRGQAAPLYADMPKALNARGVFPIVMFEKGGITTNAADSSYNAASRMRTIGTVVSAFDIEITTGTGTQSCDIWENINGTWEHTGWLLDSQKYIIKAGTEFRICASLTYTTNTPANIEQIVNAFNYKLLKNENYIRTAYNSSTRRTINVADVANYKAIKAKDGYEIYALHDGVTGSWQKYIDISAFNVLTSLTCRKANNGTIAAFEADNAYIGIEYSEEDPIYINAATGNDSNVGSARNPLKTINEAIARDRLNMFVAPALYNEILSFNNRKNVSIKIWSDSSAFNDPSRKRIEITSGEILNITALATPNIYTAPYTYTAGDNFDLVFISQVNPPTTAGSVSTEYNALLAVFSEDVNERPLLTPVLTSADMLATDHTFYYDGSNVYIHESKKFDYAIIPNVTNRLIEFIQCENINIESVSAIGATNNVIQVNYSTNARFYDCKTAFSAKGNGWAIYNTNVIFENCKSYAISADGYNLHRYGSSKLINCIACYCGDDGVSHHEGCEGVIIGGEYSNCTSGGISPAFGAIVNIYNAYCHNNKRGLQFLGDNNYALRTCIVTGVISQNNTIDLYSDRRFIIVLANSSYTSKSMGSSTLIEY